MKGSGEDRGKPQLTGFRILLKKDSFIPYFITCIEAKGYLKSCHGNCVPKFSPSDVTNVTFEEECGNPR